MGPKGKTEGGETHREKEIERGRGYLLSRPLKGKLRNYSMRVNLRELPLLSQMGFSVL